MEDISSQRPRAWFRDALERPDLRWKSALMVLAVAGLGGVRFVFLSDSQAMWWILKLGYWLIAGTTAWFGLLLWKRLGLIDWPKMFGQNHRVGLLCVLVCALFLQVHEKRGYKVLFDEFVIAGVAHNMHFDREASFPARAHYFSGQLVTFESGVDKRPFFFAFLLSLVHDLTGYREANVFYLNAGLAAVLLLLVYFSGFSFGGARLGCLGVLLLTGLPLLAQNATGGGFELINLVMICALFLTGVDYLRSPGITGLDLFVFTAVLLAQARYESILYVLVVPAVVLCKWLRTRCVGLTWGSALAPLLLLAPLLVNKVILDDPSRFQTKPGQPAFALANLSDNLSHAIYYLFAPSFDSTNSVLLSAAGVIALVFLIALLGRGCIRVMREGGADMVLVCILVIILANTLLELCYFWGYWDDPLVARFSLPFQLMMVLAILRVTREFLKHRILPWSALAVAGAWLLFVTTPAEVHHFTSVDNVTCQEYAWFHEYLAKKSPATTLSVVGSSLAPILQNFPAISTEQAKARKWQLKACLEGEFYQEIIVLQRFEIDIKTGKLVESGPGQVGDGFVLQTLAERRLRPYIIARISRLVDVKDGLTPPPHFDEEKPPFKDGTALFTHLVRKLP